MVTALRIYYEGDEALRPGFHSFLRVIVDAARQHRCKLNLIATGATPIQDFRDALRSHPEAWNVLLLDSEEPFTPDLFDRRCSARVYPKLSAILCSGWFS